MDRLRPNARALALGSLMILALAGCRTTGQKPDYVQPTPTPTTTPSTAPSAPAATSASVAPSPSPSGPTAYTSTSFDQPFTITLPEGWQIGDQAPDMAAFYCGLDPTTKELTPADKQNLEDWYDRTLGWVPPRVEFLAKHDPRSLKATRARWEGCFRGALPKQMMPYLSIRHNTVIGNRDGLREAVLLGKAWGMTNPYIVNTIVQGAYYFTGLEHLDFIDGALDDVLDKSGA